MATTAGPLPSRNRIARVAVVMPAHNEEEHLDRALNAARRAVDTLHRTLPEVECGVMVVLDGCTDGSARITARHVAADRRISAVEVPFRSAGASRAAGIRAAGIGPSPAQPGTLRWTPRPAARIWLANTDADSQVPENWLVRQLEFADAGADAVLGSVEPDPDGMDPELLRRWRERHPFTEDHPHVYGANLGVRASAYVAAGGFPDAASHEDTILIQRLRSSAFTVTSTDSVRVLTSGRTRPRAPEGFGTYLRDLERYRPSAAG
ncbi:glycosyltransferase family 2 protein [Arthrobacter oryzae]|nr:glycosyltransferase [Arthrobacter oryzae]